MFNSVQYKLQLHQSRRAIPPRIPKGKVPGESREGEKRLVYEASLPGRSLKDLAQEAQHDGLEGGKQMKGGMEGRLQEAKLRKLD